MSNVDQVSSEAVEADFIQEKSYANKGGTVTLYSAANASESEQKKIGNKKYLIALAADVFNWQYCNE